ncbi:unnamed protein product [Callosobruchus maculatus]|uniref:Uncharacterized protein n=1 Tax=Callosobruchus maculatus TaxID=64391 RepID=A0A653BSG0_CALMS|nr:unnamed protein product [Callosobruchus maculatus]
MLPCFVCNAGGIIHVHILLFYTKCNYLYCDNSDLLQLVDSLLRTDPSNGLREAASRQLEVFRSKGPVDPGGTATATGTTVHVVRCSRTSLMASTSSTITASTGVSVPTPQAHHVTDGSFIEDFHNLQLSVNPLDVTASKSKAVVCRGASRRPPTRQRSLRRCTQTTDEGGGGGGGAGTSSANATATAAAAAVNLRRVSRLCHQIHASAVRQAFGTVTAPTAANLPTPAKPDADATAAPPNTVEIVELESSSSDVPNAAPHTNLVRTKSSSSEDIHTLSESLNKSLEDLDDFEQLQTWRRTSKIRRSLQFPKQNRQKTNNANKPVDIPERSVSVKKIKEDLEKGRRLNTVLRNNSVDLDALDHILQSISGSSGVDRNLEDTDESESNKKVKRNSFVTVESIQEVKGRLRRTSSPSSDIYKENGGKELDLESADDADDGIVVEEESCSAGQPKTAETTSRVRSYVYGMEAALLLNNKKSAACTGTTGSLESRVKLVNGNGNFSVKNEDWYNRRKSYGFEQVHAQEESSNCILKSRKQVESSTDSGICRSSELMHKTTNNAYNENHFGVENSDSDHKFNGWKEITTGQVKKLASTYDSTRSGAGGGGTGEVKSTTTITIPIVKNNNVVDLPWYDHHHHGGGIEIKRHSIAVDESRYVRRVAGDQEGRHRRTSLVANTAPASTASAGTAYFEPLEDDANAVAGRRIKKVEFCKTEVHFTAESGKVNIVATDEKPPPTQNFRRRRRTTCSSSSGPLGATAPEELLGGGSGLPVLRFGDSSEEQTMFAVGDGTAAKAASPPRPPHSRLDADVTSPHPPPQVGVVTVNATAPDHDDASASCLQNESTASEGNADDISENEIKGILKNKPTQPIPYHLGEEVVRATSPTPIVTYPSSSDEDTSKWGVKLRHVPKRPPTVPAPTSEAPPLSMWKSTVTVRNLYEKNNGQDKIQQRLRSLRPTTKNAATDTIDPSTEGHRGYSTKINFGEGQATVVKEEEEKVDDDRRWGRQAKERLANTIWSRPSADESHLPLYKDESEPDSLQQKGLVVRIGTTEEDYHHAVRSKTTTSANGYSDTITTKITIDLSKSPLSDHFSAHQRSHFKSTSLILSTIKDKTATKQQQRSVEETKKNQYQPRADKPSSLKEMCSKAQSTDTNLHTSSNNYFQGIGKICTTADGQKAFDNHRNFTNRATLVHDNSLEYTEGSLKQSGDSGSTKRSEIKSENMNERSKYRRRVSSSPHLQRSLPHPSDAAHHRILENGDIQLEAGSSPEMISNGAVNDSLLSMNCDNRRTRSDSREFLRSGVGSQIPLQMLKRLYEAANGIDNDASAADNEVQQLMSGASEIEATPQHAPEDECSVVSGSWSKMRAYRVLWENRTKSASGPSRSTAAKGKDSSLAVHGKTGDSTKARDQEECRTAHCRLSPVRNAEHWPPVTPDLTPVEKLSSPFLVGKTGVQSSRTTAIAAPDNIVLRQPKKSEMTYFGIKVSPSPKKKQVSQATIRKETKLFTEKPDLLQHHAAKSISPTRSKFNKPRQKTPEPIYENVHAGAANDNKYRGREFDASGILDELTKAADQILQAVNGYTDEDTKQSTDEEKQKLETIDEAKSWKQTASSTNEAKSASNVKSKLKHTSSTSSVESITKKGKNATTPTTERRQQYRSSSQQTKEKKQDSRSDISCSTSSKTAAMTAVNANANSKANRRLQRANSREALLHSHGSSSEDLPNRTKASVRKPRLVKKTKAVQLTMSNGLEMKKKTGTKNSGGSSTGNIAAPREKKERLATTAKADERILNSLPEIRHKTAFSTIRSTSEKVTKDRAKYKHEDIKKKTPSKRDTPSRGGSTAAETASPTCIGDNSKCDRTAAAAASTDNSINQCSTTPTETKGDRRHRPAVTGAPAVTQHRISTANIKKCCSSNSGRSEGVKP